MILGEDEKETDAKNRTLTNSSSELTNPLEIVKKQFRLLNHLILMSELGFKAEITILVPDEKETDAKNRTSTNLAYELTNPLEMVKKNLLVFGIVQF